MIPIENLSCFVRSNHKKIIFNYTTSFSKVSQVFIDLKNVNDVIQHYTKGFYSQRICFNKAPLFTFINLREFLNSLNNVH